ncbi:von Willebrand factor type A domain-containing protein [Trichlorobacter thiogenes]|uniref:von Willebrand factor type A domain-containing protein n=1 Tax=Trichlorobacter thiogenes TaxID=115783 RepID=A0A1T4SB05_9BACT|nr:vWA domain-containing protein [Trichlorobacter thiogenes]SKA25286.1 von Willebrand factor type A domain-containing protein [Trichlorobacter thiogenes]
MLLSKCITLLFLLVITVIPCSLYAAPDQYPGDTSIYGATTEMLKPNILIILDNSGSMTGTVCAATGAYNPSITYPSAGYSTNRVYRVVSGSYSSYITNVTSVVTSCGGLNPRNLLQTTGQYSGRGLKSTGVCDGSSTSGVYVLGNYINYLKGGGCAVYKTKIDIAKEVVTNLLQNTNGVNFGIMKFNESEGGTFIKKSVSGSDYFSTIKDMDAIHSGSTTNRQALLSIVSDYTASTWTPLAETLYEAMLYYKGGTRKFGQTGFNASYKYTSPVTASCQKNYVILVTDGMSTQDQNTVLGTNIGDYDHDGADPGNFDSDGSHYLDDVAKYLYDEDLFPDGTYPSMQGIYYWFRP